MASGSRQTSGEHGGWINVNLKSFGKAVLKAHLSLSFCVRGPELGMHDLALAALGRLGGEVHEWRYVVNAGR